MAENSRFGPDIELKEEDRIGLDQTQLPFFAGISASDTAFGAGFNKTDQVDTAVAVAQEFVASKGIENIDAKEMAEFIRNPDTPFQSALADREISATDSLDTQLRVLKAKSLTEINNTLAEKGTSIEALNKAYLDRIDVLKSSDKRASIKTSVVGGVKAFFRDPYNWVTLVAPEAGIQRLASRMGIAALFEAAVLTQVDAPIEEKAGVVAGGSLGPAFSAVAKRAGKLISKLYTKSKGSPSKLLREIDKEVIAKLDPTHPTTLKAKGELESIKQIVKKYPEAGIEDVFELKAKLSQGLTGEFKAPKAKVTFEIRKGASKLSADSVDELIDKIAANPNSFNKELLEREILAKADDFITPSGKYAAEFAETPRLNPKFVKGGSEPKFIPGKVDLEPLKFKTRAQAELAIKKLETKDAFPEVRAIKELKKGGFAVVKESDATYIPGIKSFKTRELAEQAIKATAKRFDLEEETLGVVEGKFLNKKTGESGKTFKIAQDITRSEIEASRRGLPFVFEESPFKKVTRIAEPLERVEQPFPEIPAEKTISNVSQDLDVAISQENFSNLLPALGSEAKAFNGQIKQAKEALDIFKGCLL